MSPKWSAVDGPWRGDGIAIIGMAGRFPAARSVAEFWANLRDGRDCIARLTDDELAHDGVDEATRRHERFVPAGAVLDDIELFDAEFFGISPREAAIMDPQHRLFLETVQEALDDASLDPDRTSGGIGMYAGCRASGYWRRLLANGPIMTTMGWHQVAAGNDKDFLATQASFRFDLRGPSVNVQNACSTSLLAVSLACDALIAGHCDAAVAGGVSIAVPQRNGYIYQPSGIASSDGRCRPFDAAASGSVLGNGVAVVVLERVERALRLGRRIYAVIRAAAVNNDGHAKSSFAAPSVKGQADVIARALRHADVVPADIDYVEAHGTATALGDPIEVAALTRAYAPFPKRDTPRGIGSVKGNVGHLDPAAGVTSLIKVALSLHHGELPPSIHFERPNPAIDFEASGLRVVSSRQPWPATTTPRRAAVSAFGIGGTNVHAILEEAPRRPVATECRDRIARERESFEEVDATVSRSSTAAAQHHAASRDAQAPAEAQAAAELLLLSARDGNALAAFADSLASRFEEPGVPSLSDAAFSLAHRRRFRERAWVVTGANGDAASAIRRAAAASKRMLADPDVCFLFPGQGTQRPGMARALARVEPVFAKVLANVAEIAAPCLDLDLRPLLLDASKSEDDERRVQQTEVAQPLLFAFEYALARLWMHWGVRPQRTLGHSVGELVAACLCGVMSLDDAVRVVCARGRAMQHMTPGAMLAVTIDEAEARALEDDDIRIAALNAPRQYSLSGPHEAIFALRDRLKQRQVPCTVLKTSHAFHHPSMQAAADELLRTLRTVRLQEPTLPLIANGTGTWMTAAQATDPAYWAAGITAPVQFSRGVVEVLRASNPVLIECGPGAALGTLVRAHDGNDRAVVVATMASPGSTKSDRVSVLDAVGAVWQCGVPIDHAAMWSHRQAQHVSLPPYAFQRKRHWIDAAPGASQGAPINSAANGSVTTGYAAMNGGANVAAATAAAAPANVAGAASPICVARTWQPTTVPPARDADPATWLVLADASGPGAAICERLTRAGRNVIAVLAGHGFHAMSDKAFVVAPGSADDAAKLVERLGADEPPMHVVNCWTLQPPTGPLTVERADTGVQLGFHGPVAIVQALARKRRAPASIDVLVSRLFNVTGSEVADPTFAPALGIVRVMPQELSDVRARLIDLGSPSSAVDAQLAIEQAVNELLAGGAEPVIAWRGGVRFAETFGPLNLPAPETIATRLRPRGTYVITGGFGGIGRVLARTLAQTPQVQLVLVGRRGAPLEQQDDYATGARQLIRELEERGATVLAIAADVTRPAEVERVVREVHQRFGPVSGLIHTAGVPGGGFLISRDLEIASAVFAPKVRATVALLSAIAPDRPDFVALCSSLASVVGGPGQGDYCGANAFLDAIAWYGRAVGMPVTSIGWPAWREVGMAASMSLPPELEKLKRDSLAAGIDPEYGARLFGAIVVADHPHALVPQASHAHGVMQAAVGGGCAAVPGSARPTAAARAVPPCQAQQTPRPVSRADVSRTDASGASDLEAVLQSRLAAIWSDVLGVTVSGADANFFELGGQSLMALQVVTQLREQFPIELDLTDVLQHPSLAALTRVVHGRLVQTVATLPDERVHALLTTEGA